MKRIASLLALIIILNLPISCDRGCGGGSSEFFIVTELTSEIGTILLNGSNRYSIDKSSSFEEGAIIITINGMEFVDRVSQVQPINPFMSASYACEPTPPKPFQTLQEIEIISSKAIFMDGVEFEPGSSLSDVFIVNDNYNKSNSIDAYLNSQLDEEWKRFGANSSYMGFRLSAKPDVAVSQDFTFIFNFDDGTQYEVNTPIFTIE